MHFLDASDDEREQKPAASTAATATAAAAASAPRAESGRRVVIVESDSDDGDCETAAAKANVATSNVDDAHSNASGPSKSFDGTEVAVEGVNNAAAAAGPSPHEQLDGADNDVEGVFFAVPGARATFAAQGGDKDLTTQVAKWGLAPSMRCQRYGWRGEAPLRAFDSLLAAQSQSLGGVVSKSGANVSGGDVSWNYARLLAPLQTRTMFTEFALAFFNSSACRAHFMVGDGRGGAGVALGTLLGSRTITEVGLTPLTCRATTLALLERLRPSPDGSGGSNGAASDELDDTPASQDDSAAASLVRQSNGRLVRMADVYLPHGVTVADELRNLVLNEDESEHAGFFSSGEKNEFLYHVLWRLLAGGAVNQYEDDFEPYRAAVREMYKSFVAVERAPSGNAAGLELVSRSIVAQITGMWTGPDRKRDAVPLFPKDDGTGNHNFLYLIVDPKRRECAVWYNTFFSAF